ncbi:hypothetical protein IE53DRAFT_312848 [Violaceomyces palustris]|uniref:Uncharacterized protein n=1 Tax=Violaceomyces palustris TaxID=1673888 RepID=A0ACD0P206_9BASI|nr:hypothetical protein IE53DRAFT_312848 [Violaceomyces palustris]
MDPKIVDPPLSRKPTSSSSEFEKALSAARVLAGERDEALGIRKATSASSLSEKAKSFRGGGLSRVLGERLEYAQEELKDTSLLVVWNQDEPQWHSSERVTGQASLALLVAIHLGLLEKKRSQTAKASRPPDPAAGVESDRKRGKLKLSSTEPEPHFEVTLGVKDIRVARTLISLSLRWSLQAAIRAYDQALVAVNPKAVRSAKKDPETSRFEEIPSEVDEKSRRTSLGELATARNDLAHLLNRFKALLTDNEGAGSKSTGISTPTDVSVFLLRLGVTDLLGGWLRLAFGPMVPLPAPKGATEEAEGQKRDSAAFVSSLLTFLSTVSAYSSLSAVISNPLRSSASEAGGKSESQLQGSPEFVRASASKLLSAQLLRPDGVRALFIVTLGGLDIDEASDFMDEGSDGGKDLLNKYENLSKLLLTPPQRMPGEVYFNIVIPKLVDIVDPDPKTTITPPSPSHMRAASFVLTRLAEKQPDHLRATLQERIYSSFEPDLVPPPPNPNREAEVAWAVTVVDPERLVRSISLLTTLLVLSEPSPDFFDFLYSPILAQLLSLYSFLSKPSAAAVAKVQEFKSKSVAELKDQVDKIVRAWMRLVESERGAKVLADCLRRSGKGIGSGCESESGDECFFWGQDSRGVSVLYGRSVPPQDDWDLSNLLGGISFEQLARAVREGDSSEDGGGPLPAIPATLPGSLSLNPDPKLLVGLLKATQRRDVAQTLLPRVLEGYIGQKAFKKAGIERRGESLETKAVFYLQMILHLFEAFGSEILQNDIKTTLSFVDFSLMSPSERRKMAGAEVKVKVLESEDEITTVGVSKRKQAPIPSLFDIGASASQQEEGAEFDVEVDDAEGEVDEELVNTALTLLLSLLEGDEKLSTENVSLLQVIESKLDSHADSRNRETASLAKEAKLVLTARRSLVPVDPACATKDKGKVDGKTGRDEPLSTGKAKAMKTYQEALKLLQDPILPVRAHGLILLTKLVSSDSKSGGMKEDLDPALIPAILDILLQAIQDDESYLYLNAVKGLSEMASSHGGGMIKRLVSIYLSTSEESVSSRSFSSSSRTSKRFNQREVDKVLRIGEALLQVIQKLDKALEIHVDLIVPPLLEKLSQANVPSTIRSSIISILGTTVEAIPLGLATRGLSRKMVQTCSDLIRIETVVRKQPVKSKSSRLGTRARVKGKAKEGGETSLDLDLDEEEEEEGEEENRRGWQDATSTDSTSPSLRRSAILLLSLLLRGTKHQVLEGREEEEVWVSSRLESLTLPGGASFPPLGDVDRPLRSRARKDSPLLVDPGSLSGLRILMSFSREKDDDAVVRYQAEEALREISELEVEIVRAGGILR